MVTANDMGHFRPGEYFRDRHYLSKKQVQT